MDFGFIRLFSDWKNTCIRCMCKQPLKRLIAIAKDMLAGVSPSTRLPAIRPFRVNGKNSQADVSGCICRQTAPFCGAVWWEGPIILPTKTQFCNAHWNWMSHVHFYDLIRTNLPSHSRSGMSTYSILGKRLSILTKFLLFSLVEALFVVRSVWCAVLWQCFGELHNQETTLFQSYVHMNGYRFADRHTLLAFPILFHHNIYSFIYNYHCNIFLSS